MAEQELAQILATFTPEQRLQFEKEMKANGLALPDLSDPKSTPLANAGYAALSTLGKIGDILDTGENAVISAARPVIEGVAPQTKKVYQEKGFNVLASDITDEILPRGTPGWVRGVVGFGADIATDPLTYTGIGGLTKAGEVLSKAKSLAKAGELIKPSSELAAEIAQLAGKSRATRKMIAEASVALAPTLEEQARMGQRALLSIGNPFTGSRDLTLVKGAALFGRLQAGADAVKGLSPVKKLIDVFSTSTGNKEFDAFRDEMVALGRDRRLTATENAVEHAKKVESFAKKFGLEKTDVEAAVTSLAENTHYGDATASEVVAANRANLQKSIAFDRAPIERTIQSLPQFRDLPMSERARLLRSVTDQVALDQAGYNVYTNTLSQLPLPIRREFAQKFSDMAGLRIGTGFGRGNKLKTAKVGEIYTRFFDSGEDAALQELLGKKNYDRVLADHEKLLQTNAKLGVPAAYTPVTEYAQAQHNLNELLSHTNQMFATTYNIWKSNPKYVEKAMPDVASLLSKAEADKSWRVDALMNQFKVPLKYAKQYPQLYDYAQEVRRWGQEQLLKEQAAGVPTGQFIGDIGYVAHVPVKEVRKWLEQNGGQVFKGAAKEWTTNHQSQFVRSLRVIDEGRVNAILGSGWINKRQAASLLNRANGNNLNYLDKMVEDGVLSAERARSLVHTLTVDEVNTLARNGKLRLLGNQSFKQFFETNPAEIIRVRGTRGARAITGAEFLEGSKQFGTKIAQGTLPPPGHALVTAPELAGYAFEKDVAKHIDKYYESIKLPAAAHPFLQAYDALQDTWKAWTLSMFPSYHMRNTIGNAYNNFLAGMNVQDAHFYGDAAKIQKGMKFSLETAGGTKYSRDQIYHLARRYGVIDTGQFAGDIEKYFETEAKGIGALTRNAVINGGLKVGGWIENNAKLAHFMWQLKSGISPVDAAASVKKYLFDYRNLSDTEKQIFRRVLPFYTWTRNNVPLQLQALATQPGKVGGVFKIKNSLETDLDGKPDERLLPDWMVQNYPIRIRKNQQTGNFEYFLLGSWLPATDIDKIFDPVQTVKNMLGPLIKEPIQQATNRDFFTGREIDTGDEYQRLLGINMPARTAHALKNIRVVNEADKLAFGEDSDTYGRVLRFMTAKLQPLDEEQAKKSKQFEFSDREKNLKRLLKKARNRGDDEEEARLQKKIDALREKKSAVLQ